jgi:hypothetical protein
LLLLGLEEQAELEVIALDASTYEVVVVGDDQSEVLTRAILVRF